MAATLCTQQDLFEPVEFVANAVERLSRSGDNERGAVFTRREVVEFILDLAGYTTDKPLWKLRLLEPSFGLGDFLEVVIERLIQSWRLWSDKNPSMLYDAVRGVEIHRETFNQTAMRIKRQLCKSGLSEKESTHLVSVWLHSEDFLLKRFLTKFDVIVGNPPYVRQEMIPGELLAEYRRRFLTIFDRADLYVPFIEKSLSLLSLGGAVAFICSDRWMKNRYGGPLRAMVGQEFHLRYYVDMVGTQSFTSEVTAYPAITVIGREQGNITRVAYRPSIDTKVLKELAAELKGEGVNKAVTELPAVVGGSEPWVMEEDSLNGLRLVRRLEEEFPTIEEAGCKVGIGVATGADQVFIGQMDQLDVEPSRKLRLVRTRDIGTGEVNWQGFGVINPFEDDGSAVDLESYPKLKSHFEKHDAKLKQRHVAQRGGAFWYRTIDRITPGLAATPKLLIPDIKGTAHVVFEEGLLYPHHNLYFLTSEEWDLKALRAVLLSGLAMLFIATYSTKMRGGCFRFQAQYLRRIRIPRWNDIAISQRKALVGAAEAGNVRECNEIVAEIFGLSSHERSLISRELNKENGT